jgi:thioredoxin-related protein
MVCLAAVLFVARIALMLNNNNDVTVSPLHWLTPEQLNATKLRPDQQIFYDFTAKSCGPCDLMDRLAFRDRFVIAELKKHFILVRVVDPDPKDSHSDKVEVRRLQQRYEVTSFPQFFVVLPSGVTIASRFGYCPPHEMFTFLLGAEKKSEYFAGRSLIIDNPGEAAKKLEHWLNDGADWTDVKASLAAAYAAVCYREVHDEQGAMRVLKEAQDQLPKESWNRGLIDYLAGRAKLQSVIEESQEADAGMTDAKGVAAMNLRAQGKTQESDELLAWVRDNGQHSSFAYDWSLAVLGDKKTSVQAKR